MHLSKVTVTVEQTVDDYNNDHNDDMVVESDAVIHSINDIEVDKVGKDSNTVMHTGQSGTMSMGLIQ